MFLLVPILTDLPTLWLQTWWGDRIWRVCSFSECLPPRSTSSR